MGELVPHSNADQLVIKKDYTYANYDGITLFQATDGNVGLGTSLDEKTLALARRGEVDPESVRFERKLFNGLAVGSATFFGALSAIAPFVNESPVSTIIVGTVLTGISHAESYLPGFVARKRHKAIVAMSEGLTQIPSRPISMQCDGLPERLELSSGPFQTNDLVEILQGMHVLHLSSEAASQYRADNPSAVTPAMVVKGGLFNLSESKRGPYLQEAFDRATSISDLSTSLYRHAPLAVTKEGREGLRRQSVELLGHLGELACTFVDLKAAEVIPKVQNLIDVADDQDISGGLNEAHHVLNSPGLSMQRYQLVTRSWGDAGTV